jgi:hypothetical protein
MDLNKLMDRLDDDENLSDSEKREIYFAALAEQEDMERWEEEHD